MKNKFFVTLLAALAVPAALPAQVTVPAAAEKAAAVIDEDSLKGPIRFLADDLLEGRGPASRGDRLSQLYLGTTLQYLGFEPAFENGSYIQPVDVVSVTADVPKSWQFSKGGQNLTLKFWDQFIAASGVQEAKSTLNNSEIVFVGYGIKAPEHKWDDFKGTNLKGKVLLMLNNDPDWDPQLFEGERRLYYGRWTYKYESAAAQGAAGAIIIHTTPSAGYPFQVVQTSWTGPQFELPAEGEPRLQVQSWVTEDAARQLVKLAGQDLDALVKSARSRDFKPVPLGVTTSLAMSNKVEKVQTANVGGLMRGSDPKLKDEVIIFSAHHDHLGIGEPDKTGDKIYNGAVDNAAGVAQVVAIARAFSELPEPPRRSVLFLFVAAEEQGLLGSEYYAKHPTFPPGKIAANINYDGGNNLGRGLELAYIGLGKSSLDKVVTSLAATQDRKVVGDQFPDRGSFYRSDQFNFAKIGVPAIYLDAGTKFRGRPEEWGKEKAEEYEAKDYHQPSDELRPDWNFDGMIEDAKLGFYAGVVLANDDKMPTWNPGDEFEAARKAAIAKAAQGDRSGKQ
ncbi:MAG TPA: M20/M25/M40 family metallo-hydrolase [Thermoanaerobaculia bacterium]|nr:M20/M25/M40 family metallo-hydrolase [Thermoanaerobaculia bacterium]